MIINEELLNACRAALTVLTLDSDMEEDFAPEIKQLRVAITHARLEYLRAELRAERISYAELAELQSLAEYIPAHDVELLEAAGVPETQ